MSQRSRALGLAATIVPNRKFAATQRVMADTRLVAREDHGTLMRANAAFVWSYYARFARLANRRARRRSLAAMSVLGERHLRKAIEPGRGVILLSVHLGDFDVAGAWLASRCGVTPVIVTRPLSPRWREAAFSGVRRRCGVVVREVGSTSLLDLETDLLHGRAVLMMLDRRPSGPTTAASLLGRPAVAALAISTLAARTGAALLPAATWRDEHAASVAWFGEPCMTADTATAAVFVAQAATHLGRHIRDHPSQWHVPTDLSELAWSVSPDDARRSGLVQAAEGVSRNGTGAEHVSV